MIEFIFLIVSALLVVCSIFSIIRMAIGPTVADRIVGLDTINTIVVAEMIILSVVYNAVIYVDIAIVYALLSFISTLFIANYLEGEIPPAP